MADLLAILSQGASSLGAHRASAATASHNLENANTPGYARQSASLEAMLPAEAVKGAFLGRGVGLNTVSQARDRFLESQIPGALANASKSQTESDALSSMHALDPDLPNGMTTELAGLFSSLRALAQNPGSGVLRQGAVDAASGLAQTFQRTAGAIDDARTGLDQKADGLVTQVNSLARQMADMNASIRSARATGAEPNDLLDARQRLQDSLAELTGALPVPNGQGDVSMVLPTGFALVSEDKAAQLSTQPDATNRGHLEIKATLADGSGLVSVTSLGGTLGGVLSARDGALKSSADSLDTLAFDLANALNAVHSAGYALDGSTGHDLFTVGATSLNAAGTITVDAGVAADPGMLSTAATAGGVPGDATNALALVNVETTLLSSGGSAESSLSQIVAEFGTATQRASSMSDQEGTLKTQLTQLRDSTSGVSIDEEMVSMTQAQRAYEAVTKVITAADQMLQSLMAIT